MATPPPGASGRRRRRWPWILGGLAILVAVAGAVVGIGLVRGWFDSGSVTGSTEGFVPAAGPRGEAHAHAWPEYGFDARRTRANAAIDLRPPLREVWRHDAGSLVEYLKSFELVTSVMQSERALTRIAREFVADLAADGVIYGEMRWAPEQHLAGGLDLDAAVRAAMGWTKPTRRDQ